jgi:ribonucleoside-diphosphate reductase alpha chain
LLSSLGYKIFVDRYARKTHDNFVIGDKVFVKYNGHKDLGTVLSLSDDTVEVKLENGNDITCEKSNVYKPVETPNDMFWRVAKSVASAEENKEQWTYEFFHLMEDFKFIPGGRILAAAGNDSLSWYNCFVIPSPKDCREGIVETLQTMIEIMSRGGGVGINISSLRSLQFCDGVNLSRGIKKRRLGLGIE